MNGGWEVNVSGNTTHYRKKLYDAYGNHVGTIGICKPTKQTGKRKRQLFTVSNRSLHRCLLLRLQEKQHRYQRA